MAEEYEFTRTASRDEVVAVLLGLADGIAAGGVRIDDGDEEHTVDVPDHVDVEVEFERGDEDTSLEVELEWPNWSVDDEETAATDEAAIAEQEGMPTDEPGSTAPDASPTADEPGERGRSDSGADASEAEEPASDEVIEEESAGDESIGDEQAGGTVGPSVGAAAPVESFGRFELFEDRAGEWRWRLVHRNGNVVATSGEGYTRKHNALKGLRSVMRNAPDADVGEKSGK